ncbi:HAD family hydrolase [Actinomadura yumaensis]|uniref:HAD family hydrolase n=1 Tax=Actinomadura yumaensis TaxID=111807 RepID=UPI00361C269D
MNDAPTRKVDWIVTDLDGTLVGRDLRIVGPNLAALRRFADAGGDVVVATGRGEESARPYYERLGLRNPAILYNGARVVDLSSGAVLYRRCLSAAVWANLVMLFEELPAGVWPVAFSGGRAHVRSETAALRAYAHRDGIGLHRVGSWAELPFDEVVKTMLICERPGLVDDAAALLREVASGPDGAPAGPGAGATLVRSESTYLEVLPAGATRGRRSASWPRRAGCPCTASRRSATTRTTWT